MDDNDASIAAAALHLDAAKRLLVEPPNELAADHVRLVAARLRDALGYDARAADDPWRERFSPVEALPEAPTLDPVRDVFATLMALHVLAKQELAARP